MPIVHIWCQLFYRAPEGDMIRWVVTVPAIWTEESKQFMREAAFKVNQAINMLIMRGII